MTPNALILSSIALFTLLAALNVQSGWLFLVGYSFIALILSSLLLGRLRLRGLSLETQSSGIAEAGEKTQLLLRLENLRNKGALIACMSPPVGRRARKRHFYFDLVPEGWTFEIVTGPHLSLEIETPHRGEYELPAIILACAPLALWTSAKKFPSRGKILVLPRTHRLPSLPWLSLSQGAADGIPRSQVGGDLFRAIREYRSGDSLRQVHWKSTAKRGELMVKETESERGGTSVALVLDPVGEEGTLGESFEVVEQVFSVAASIAAHLHGRGIEVTIFSGGGGAPNGLDEQLRWMAKMLPSDKKPPLVAGAVLITGRAKAFDCDNFIVHCGLEEGGSLHCPPGCDAVKVLGGRL